jgi:hypothetical protein
VVAMSADEIRAALAKGCNDCDAVLRRQALSGCLYGKTAHEAVVVYVAERCLWGAGSVSFCAEVGSFVEVASPPRDVV